MVPNADSIRNSWCWTNYPETAKHRTKTKTSKEKCCSILQYLVMHWKSITLWSILTLRLLLLKWTSPHRQTINTSPKPPRPASVLGTGRGCLTKDQLGCRNPTWIALLTQTSVTIFVDSRWWPVKITLSYQRNKRLCRSLMSQADQQPSTETQSLPINPTPSLGP